MIAIVKKFSVFLVSFLFVGLSYGYWETLRMNSSSFTTTNEGPIAISSNNLQGGIFVGVVVGSDTVGGTLKIWDARNPGGNVAISTITIINLTGTGNGTNNTPYYLPFDVRLSSGLTYQTSGNSNGVTIIYKITKPTPTGF